MQALDPTIKMMKRLSFHRLKATLVGRKHSRRSVGNNNPNAGSHGDRLDVEPPLLDGEFKLQIGDESTDALRDPSKGKSGHGNLFNTIRCRLRKGKRRKRGHTNRRDSHPNAVHPAPIESPDPAQGQAAARRPRARVSSRCSIPASIRCIKRESSGAYDNEDLDADPAADVGLTGSEDAEDGGSDQGAPAVPDAEVLKTAGLTAELFRLSKCGWYWGPITRGEAEDKLADQPDGAFLVRDSSDDRHLLSLSFRSYGRTLHTRIEHCNGFFSFYAQPEPEGHRSVVELVEQSVSYSRSGVFCYSRSRSPGSPSFPVRLTRPVSRFTQVRTLQYLCRFVIRQYTRFDHIQRLPLPTRIKGYIEEGHY